MSDAMNSHATAIKQAARDLAQGNIWATDRHIETIDLHADDLATELDEANARNAKIGIALYAAQHYIDALNKGIGPSHPHYLPLRDAYQNAMKDLDTASGDTAGEGIVLRVTDVRPGRFRPIEDD